MFRSRRRARSEWYPGRMGRLDDIVARNTPKRGGGGLIGAVIAETTDPAATPEERDGRQLAWVIVGGAILAVVLLVAILS